MKVKGSSTLANSIVNTAETIAAPEVIEAAVPVQTEAVVTSTENNEHVQTAPPVTENTTPEKSETVVSTNGELKTGDDADAVSDFIIPEFEEKEKNTPQSTPAAETQTSWKDVLKSVDRKEILKELGINDFAIEINEHLSKGGKAIDYLNAKAVDWEKVPDADVILSEMKKEFPDATQTQLQRLFNKKYNQTDLNDEEEREDGELLMKSDARKIKQAKIAEQQSFKLPEQTAPNDTVSEEQKKQQALLAQKQQELQQLFNNHESTKSLLQSKRVAVNVGVEGARAINYNIDPKQVMDVLFNPEVNNKFGRTKTGEPDVQLAYEMALFKMNPTQFKKDLYNAGVSAGHRKELEAGQNAQKPTGTVPAGQTKTLGEVFKTSAKNGTLASHIR